MEKIVLREIVASDSRKTSCGFFTEDAVGGVLALLKYRNPGTEFTVNPPMAYNELTHPSCMGMRAESDDGIWVSTDDLCAQYRMKVDGDVYVLMQATACADGTYGIVKKAVDLTDYPEEDLDGILSPYYEGGIKGMEAAYGMPLECLKGIAAECVFETETECEMPAHGDYRTLDEAADAVMEKAGGGIPMGSASVLQEKRTGRWEPAGNGDEKSHDARCTCCRTTLVFDDAEWQHLYDLFRFCPHCGAEMRGGTETKCKKGDTMRKTKRQPMTGGKFFGKICSILVEKGLYPDILEYDNAARDSRALNTDEFAVTGELGYGGSEGILLYVCARFYRDGETVPLGMFKTLYTDDEAMRTMGVLLADFTAEACRYMSENEDKFEFTCYRVRMFREDGTEAAVSFISPTREMALERKDMAFDKERAKLRRRIRDLEAAAEKDAAAIKALESDLNEAKAKIEEQEDWIRRLLEYTDMTESDMRSKIDEEKRRRGTMSRFAELTGMFDRFGMQGIGPGLTAASTGK